MFASISNPTLTSAQTHIHFINRYTCIYIFRRINLPIIRYHTNFHSKDFYTNVCVFVFLHIISFVGFKHLSFFNLTKKTNHATKWNFFGQLLV